MALRFREKQQVFGLKMRENQAGQYWSSVQKEFNWINQNKHQNLALKTLALAVEQPLWKIKNQIILCREKTTKIRERNNE